MIKILAIDIGTASVSGAYAEKKFQEKPEVIQVFRFFWDSLEKDGNRKVISKISKMFSEVHKSKHDPDFLKIGFSTPFFIEKIVTNKFKRRNPNAPISENEIRELMTLSKSDIGKKLIMASFEIIESRVNGYIVTSPIGYNGGILELKIKLLLISKSLKDHVEKLQDKFFHKAKIDYFSDFSVLNKIISSTYKTHEPIIIDVGGEVTTINTFNPLPFGIRTIERRVSSSLKISLSDAEAVLRKSTSGNLDWQHERILNKVLRPAIENWWNLVKNILNDRIQLSKNNKIFLSGAGTNFSIFENTIHENLLKAYNLDMNIIKISAENLKENFTYLKFLSGGEDAILAGLISLYEH